MSVVNSRAFPSNSISDALGESVGDVTVAGRSASLALPIPGNIDSDVSTERSGRNLDRTCFGGRSVDDTVPQCNDREIPPCDRDGSKVGSVIGKYRIESIIASGGMGTVFKAQQEYPVRRTVALKMIKAGAADQNSMSRFFAERQLLALMDHPDIARVYEADATPDGNPYFAMEFCDGEPIDEFCRRRNLTIRTRVELVARLARAVSRAHANGVIHRDLKPGNVLVSESGDQLQLKVIDFGIAKCTGEPSGFLVHATQIGELVGTPAYMSPEQAIGNIDARTDVFAIGAILCKLLTGSTPLTPPACSNPSLAQLIQHIQGFQGLTPTQRFRELSSDEQENLIRECCLRNSTQWLKSVCGDLDWITLRALEPDRLRRYATASDLADDLERHLRQEPVVAAAPSRWYRWTKFYRRRKSLVWSLTVAVSSIMFAGGISGFLWWQYRWQAWNDARQVRTEAAVLLAEAKQQQQSASQDPLADEAQFLAALTAAARAETLLKGRVDMMPLQHELSDLQVQLTNASRGFQLAGQLEAARIASTEQSGLEAGDHFGRLAGLQKMRTAWVDFDVVPGQTSPETAAGRIQALPLQARDRIVESLDFLLYEDPFGAGLYLHQQGSRISVAEVIHGGGAERAAQLRKGDRILKINDVSLLEWTTIEDVRTEAYRLLAGPPGQRVEVTFVRGLSDPQQAEIICGGANAHWAGDVLAILDPNPWRNQLRKAVLQSDVSKLHALADDPNFHSQPPFSLIQLAGTLFMLERTNESLRFLELAQQQHPQNFWANHYLGTALSIAHDPPMPEVGVRYLTSAVALRPDSPGARLNLAEALLQLGYETEALAHFETAKNLAPNHVPLERRLASLLQRAQKSENLESAAAKIDHPSSNEQAVSTVPAADLTVPDFDALDRIEKRARELASRGQRREALLLVSQAEQYHAGRDNQGDRAETSSPPAELVALLRRLKGIVLLELQDFTAARVVLADAARLNPGDAATRFYHGVALEHSGDSPSAIQEYEAALKIRPDYEAVREFLRNLKQPD